MIDKKTRIKENTLIITIIILVILLITTNMYTKHETIRQAEQIYDINMTCNIMGICRLTDLEGKQCICKQHEEAYHASPTIY